jgi:hypothetical protein
MANPTKSSRKTWEVWFAETKRIGKIRVSYASLELVCMHEAIQWQSNKHKLHCVDGLAALFRTTAYYVPGLYLHSWVQTPARWLVQWGHLMTSVSSWDRTRRCPFDATAYTTAPAHLAGKAALLHLFSQRGVSLDPGLLQFLPFATFECRIKTRPCPWPNPPRSSGKKLSLPKTVLV